MLVKRFLQGILILFFVVLFIVDLVLVTFRFQILNKDFWITSLEEGAVYEILEQEFTNYIEDTFVDNNEIISEGRELAKVFDKESIQIFLERNIELVFAYINNEAPEIVVYIPIEEFPSDIKQRLEINSEEISLDYLIRTYGKGSTPIGKEAFDNLRTINRNIIVPLIVITILLIVDLIMLYILETKDHRHFGMWAALIASGISTFIMIIFVSELSRNAFGGDFDGDIGGKLVLSIVPSLTNQIIRFWTIVGASTVATSFVFLALKKR